jgi:uncharacterized membrane protein SirB2
MPDYNVLKSLHIGAVYLSGALFISRGLGMLTGGNWHLRGVWRVLPHLVDSVLLLAAVGLLIWLSDYPLREPWLITKLVALLVYIGLGTVALKSGKTHRIRVGSFAAALMVYVYIIGVAVTRSPSLGIAG